MAPRKYKDVSTEKFQEVKKFERERTSIWKLEKSKKTFETETSVAVVATDVALDVVVVVVVIVVVVVDVVVVVGIVVMRDEFDLR